jgi:single-strand DNA-binding protein
MNVVVLQGNLTRNPESRDLPSGKYITSFRIAVPERPYKKDGELVKNAHFISCEAFGPTGEFVARNFKKGDAISVEGALCENRWEDKDGNKRSQVIVKCHNCNFLMVSRPKDRSKSESTDSVATDSVASEEPAPF